MAAIAGGLNILHHADVGNTEAAATPRRRRARPEYSATTSTWRVGEVWRRAASSRRG